MDDFRGKHVTVAGLGRFGGGISVARWLVSQGARVLVTDEAPAAKLSESVRQLDGLPIEFRLGGHRESDFAGCDTVVTSPAIPPGNPFVQAARNAGVPVTTEIRLFIERCPCTTLGVTGTKGKSTTTTMLGRMLATKFRTHVGGNIGGSLLSELPSMKPDDVVVLELSSYMLEHLRPMNWSPHVALVNMISVDHVEWHGNVENYIDAKRNIVRFQNETDFAVLNEENATSSSFADHTRAQVRTYTIDGAPAFSLKLSGRHNQLNAQAAFAAARCMGVSWDATQTAVADFAGLPHRLQVVHEANGVTWVNDSIATIPEAAIAALESFPAGKVIQIVGGYDKQLNWSAMCHAVARRAKAALCIGTIGEQLARAIDSVEGRVCETSLCGTLDVAVETARRLAVPGDVVLLSTGTSSYDQFTNFELRGDAFSRLARM